VTEWESFVEGRVGQAGVFQATNLMVKHSNEYRAPKPGEEAHEKYKTLMKQGSQVIGTIAHSALLVSVAVVALGVILTPVAIRSDRRDWLQLVYGAVYTNFMLVTIAAVAMVVALVTHDFLRVVRRSRGKPLDALCSSPIISLWGALEGSILFWAWVLAMYAAAVVWLHHRRPGNLVPYAAMTLLAVAAFFAILLVGPANPVPSSVSRCLLTGRAETLLQNHILMAVHPPLLYLGYVGMSVPFAFAISAIVSQRSDLKRMGRALRAAGCSRRGASCPRRSSPECGGRTRCWGGRILGVGTLSRTRSFPPLAHRDRVPAFGDGAGTAEHAAPVDAESLSSRRSC
jgi:hypothetical protein